ncbi:cytochrome P450 94A2-like [Nymphaea colorata]|uniref:cytochrome P450 94A2-like n=1 Tax=Nymphaea colorata TaxID=210225 RepID=UPI00214E46CB|nr:cytochrome P450 94A2-like [Nymphaea colorata]
MTTILWSKAMEEVTLPVFLVTFALFLVCILSLILRTRAPSPRSASSKPIYGPKSYPIIGAAPSLSSNSHRLPEYFTELIQESPTGTVFIHCPFGSKLIVTANPSNVEHILKTRFLAYPLGPIFYSTFYDILGDGIFNADGEAWKFQRKIASHEFSTRSLRKFAETVIGGQVSDRLLPLLTSAAATGTILDLQDVLARFGFDNICRIAFGACPVSDDLSLSTSEFTMAFTVVGKILSERITAVSPVVWKIKRALGIGFEKQLRYAVRTIDDFTRNLIRERKQNPLTTPEELDLLSRFMNVDGADDRFAKDMVISFVIAGMYTTSAALTWFFWLVSRHRHVEEEIVKEIASVEGGTLGFDEVKEMNYLHAALCESMRFYPPVPADIKYAAEDDVLPDGTPVPKGASVMYHPYAMGRTKSLWGEDWEEFRPERWLRRDGADGKWRFVPEDPYRYPVFQAGPRICLGKDLAFIQMKTVAAAVLSRFRVVRLSPDFQPVMRWNVTIQMVGGFPVKVEERKT